MLSSRFGLVCAVSVVILGCSKSQPLSDPAPGASGAKAAAAETYRAKGVVKGFGEGRKTVKIAHEDIPGYMKAMTMPFGTKSPSLLDGLSEGDAVDFSFVEGAGGGLVIQTITKR
jgi:Cu(I)/Ag(I) efflux system periplasmic protein CusF